MPGKAVANRCPDRMQVASFAIQQQLVTDVRVPEFDPLFGSHVDHDIWTLRGKYAVKWTRLSCHDSAPHPQNSAKRSTRQMSFWTPRPIPPRTDPEVDWNKETPMNDFCDSTYAPSRPASSIF